MSVRIVKLTEKDRLAIYAVAEALAHLGPHAKRSQLAHFEEVANKVDEAGANQDRNHWDKCPKCNGAGIIE